MHYLFSVKVLFLAVLCIVYLLLLHEISHIIMLNKLFVRHTAKPLSLVHLNIIIVAVMTMNNLSHTPLLSVMMWEVFMHQYSNTPDTWGCNYMYGTTKYNIFQDSTLI